MQRSCLAVRTVRQLFYDIDFYNTGLYAINFHNIGFYDADFYNTDFYVIDFYNIGFNDKFYAIDFVLEFFQDSKIIF